MNVTNIFPLITGLFNNYEPNKNHISIALSAIVALGAGIALYNKGEPGRSCKKFRQDLNAWCSEAPDEKERDKRHFALAQILNVYNGTTTRLNLSGLHLTSLPKGIELLESIELLDLSHNNFTDPPNLFRYLSLRTLCLENNPFTVAPDFSHNQKLEELDLRNIPLSLPPDLSQNQKLKRLKLSNCQLSTPPDLSQNLELENLYLEKNQLGDPPDLSQHRKLEFVSFKNNQLSHWPDLSQNFPSAGLNISYNCLTGFPDWIFSSPNYCNMNTEGNPFL